MARSIVGTALRVRRELGLLLARGTIDAFVASYPKSGRTWVRHVLANYFNEAYGLGLRIDLSSMFQVVSNDGWDRERGLRARRLREDRRFPVVVTTHRPYSRILFHGKPIIYIARDPRDLMVSAFHHYTRHVRRYSGTMSDFIMDPELGFPALARHLNGWGENLWRHSFTVVRYERLSTDTETVIEDVLRFLGVAVDKSLLARAVCASEFHAMRALESAAGIPGHTYDRSDANSLRMRRGVVGSYADELSPDEAAQIERACETSLTFRARALLNSAGGSQLLVKGTTEQFAESGRAECFKLPFPG